MKARHGSFLYGLEVQSNVVGALIMRELHTRYGRENIGYLWMILEPMLLAFMISLIHLEHSYGYDIKPVPFTLIGYCIFITFRQIVNRAEGAIEANASLMYHRMVTLFDIQFARAILEVCGTFMTLTILLTLAALTGLADWPVRILPIIAAALFMAWFSFGLSLLVSAASYVSSVAGRLVHPITYVMMPLSGAFYRTEWVPNPFRDILYWFPTTHIFELARYGQFRQADDQYFSIPYLLAVCSLLTLFGMLSIRHIRQHIHL